MADPEPAPPGLPSAARPRPVRRRARAPEPHDHRPGGVQRHGDGEHDARPRLALPRHRPPARALDEHDEPAPTARSTAGPSDNAMLGAAARDRRQLDDLPPPLFRAAAAVARARPAARWTTPIRARAGVSAGGRCRSTSTSAARSEAPSPTREERLIDHADRRRCGEVGSRRARSQPSADGRSPAIDDAARTRSRTICGRCRTTITYFYFSHAELRVS